MDRKIHLKTVNEEVKDRGNIEINYAGMYTKILRAGGQQGISVGEIRDRLEVLDILEKAIEDNSKEIILTARQWQVLKDAVVNFRFALAIHSIVDLAENVEYAPEVE